MAVTGLDKVFVVNAETNTKYGGVDPTGEFVTINDLVPQPYKVYTALITQSGGNSQFDIDSGSLTIGVSYQIKNTPLEPPFTWDFTNVGAPNNEIGTYFVATGTTPNNWGNGTLTYNTGAPVVTVLENTIGNIWFTYVDPGLYYINNDNGAFTENKTYSVFQTWGDDTATNRMGFVQRVADDSLALINTDYLGVPANIIGFNNYLTSIEIRVYN